MRRAFTLLELLIVMAIVAIVIALVLPNLRVTRWRAQQLKSLANLRSQVGVLGAYANDEADHFPYFTNPEATLSVVRGGGVAVGVHHFMSFWTWNIALADNYFGGQALPDSLRIPWIVEHEPFTMYWYGDCFVARPEFWRHETRQRGPGQWRATRFAEVQFPSQKGLVLERGRPQDVVEQAFGVGDRFSLVDGSARRFSPDELNAPVADGLGIGFGAGRLPYSPHAFGIPVMHTVDGVFGRDVR